MTHLNKLLTSAAALTGLLAILSSCESDEGISRTIESETTTSSAPPFGTYQESTTRESTTILRD